MDESQSASFRSIDAEFEYQRTRVHLGLVDEQQPVRLGRRSRYELVRLLGRGAMGTVYLARDTLLARDVALKVLSAHVDEQAQTEQRLMREAQALAALNHENVLHVYDVDTAASGELFISMEYVPGQTLTAWQTGRSLEQLFFVYRQIGRGLAAAHAAGLVHRDVKPDNVFIVEAQGGSWRAVIGDFGLAGGPELRERSRRSAELRGEPSPHSTRGRMGTPAYMAPEQRDAERADARSDQYSYCVCLWEGVTGARPFGPDTPRDVLPPRPSSMPRWLYRTLRRGLQPEPASRFESLDDLLRSLVSGQRRRRAGYLAALALLVFGVALGYAYMAPESEDVCDNAGQEIDAIWNAEARQQVLDAFAALDVDHGRASGQYAVETVDDAVARWRQATLDSCRARAAWGQASVQRQCLARWRERLVWIVARLTRPDVAMADHIDRFLAELFDPADLCRAPPVLIDADVEAKLVAVEADELRARYDQAMAGIEQATKLASGMRCVAGSSHSSEMAAVLFRLAHIHGTRGHARQALAALDDAELHALGCLDADRHFDIAIYRTQVEAVDLGRPEDAADSLETAGALLPLIGEGRRRMPTFELAKTRAFVEYARGNLDAAGRAYSEALSILVEDEYLLARLHYDIGVVLLERGDLEGSKREFSISLALTSADLGAAHPETIRREVQIAVSEAIAAFEQRDYPALDQRLALVFARGGPADRLKGYTLAINAAGARERWDEERRFALEGLDLLRASDDLPVRHRAEFLTASGQALADRDLERGVALLEEALELWSSAPFPGHGPNQARLILANLLTGAGRRAEAQALLDALDSAGFDKHAPEHARAMAELREQLGASRGNGAAAVSD